MAFRSIQQLCRAAFSLGAAASTSAPLAAQLGVAGCGLRAAAAATTGSSLQPAAGAAAGLRQLARHFHASAAPCWAAGDEGLAMNPLQQAPAPAASSPLGAPGVPFGMVPLVDSEANMTSRAVARGLAISPQKLNDFAKVVRGLHVEDALIQCSISPKKAAKLVEKAILSARANAINNHGLEPERLRVAEAWVGKGEHLKRISMHGRGRSGRRMRYRSHLTVVLREEEREPRRRTKVIPMLAERGKLWRMRGAQAAQ
ncbi:hypothetical protein ABPG75_003560 [Micractinium tetrahymenae]